jgi:hypothetical protein
MGKSPIVSVSPLTATLAMTGLDSTLNRRLQEDLPGMDRGERS